MKRPFGRLDRTGTISKSSSYPYMLYVFVRPARGYNTNLPLLCAELPAAHP
jgi:hypothetical protein